MQEKRHIGLDLGVKSKSKVYIIDQAGEKVRPEFSIWTNPQGLDYMMEQALKGASKDILLDLTMEPTNVAWFGAAVYLRRKYPQVSIYRVKSEKAQDLRKFYRKHTKTDALDAQTLAKMPVVDSDSLQEVYIRPKKILALHTRCKQRAKLVKEATAKKNSISDEIELGFPRLVGCFSSKFTTPFIRFCERYANPFKVKRLGKEKLLKLLIKLGFRKDVSTLAENIYQRAKEACILFGDEESIIDYDDLQDRIRSEFRIFKSLQKEVDKVTKKVQDLYEICFPKKRLNSIPGIADVSGAVIASTIGDPDRFPSARAAVGYLGYYPKENSSGLSSKKGLRMTKAGPNMAKGSLYLIGDTARLIDPQMGKIYYEQMVVHGNPHTKAVCRVGRALISRILRTMKEDRDYVICDLEGNPISKKEGRKIVKEQFSVSEEVRQRLSNRKRMPLNKKGRTKPQCARGSKAPQIRVDSSRRIVLSLS
jgi:transposase